MYFCQKGHVFKGLCSSLNRITEVITYPENFGVNSDLNLEVVNPRIFFKDFSNFDIGHLVLVEVWALRLLCRRTFAANISFAPFLGNE